MSGLLCLARRSLHHFDSPAEEESSLIYSYSPVYVANITAYEQAYFFWATPAAERISAHVNVYML